jgi:hypothetical protein
MQCIPDDWDAGNAIAGDPVAGKAIASAPIVDNAIDDNWVPGYGGVQAVLVQAGCPRTMRHLTMAPAAGDGVLRAEN